MIVRWHQMPIRRHRMLKLILLGGLSLAAFFMAIAVTDPSPCDDQVRGFEQTAQASLSYVREELTKIDGSLTAAKTKRYLQTFEFSAAEYAAIQFCLVDCRFLSACARWKFWMAPSEACPTEYQNYQRRATEANQRLERLADAGQQVRKVVVAAAEQEDAKEKLDSVSKGYRSNDNAVKSAKAELKRTEEAFDAELALLSLDLEPAF